MSLKMDDLKKKAEEYRISLSKEEKHYFCVNNNSPYEHPQEYNKTGDYSWHSCNTLGNLRAFLKTIEHLPDTSPVIHWDEREFNSIAVVELTDLTEDELLDEIKVVENRKAAEEEYELKLLRQLQTKYPNSK
jgi:hypothetical protein